MNFDSREELRCLCCSRSPSVAKVLIDDQNFETNDSGFAVDLLQVRHGGRLQDWRIVKKVGYGSNYLYESRTI